MEDQQPGTGDLTTDAPAAKPRRRFFRRKSKAETVEAAPAAAEPVAAETVTSATKTPVGKAGRPARQQAAAQDPEPEPRDDVTSEDRDEVEAEPESEDNDAPEAEDAEPEPVVLVPHRPAGRRLMTAVAAASVVFVGASGFAAAAVQPYLSDRAIYETKLAIARTATDAITTLWTYNPDDMATLADRASVYLSGDFAAEYRRYIDAIVEPNKQAQVTNTTEVMGAAVESVSPQSSPTEATALVYTNSVATSPVTKNIPSLRYLSYRLTMQRDGGDWRITRMSTITSFDLTPQL
ncbi:mammalian cell entry protein [Mycobacterium sp. NAZ190054]|uniref:mammalian cell entry protein n=1 Tax=Mycobacterium sp. NAZ190054 TaxID=1747766 RepID=UPI00079AAF17|nr:mammalian cell entry protein [Mycobacterium sp. NAZ190054]KWX66269.1 mammalian cell entry protein [Mycobacterium sp. NAZ190054]